MNQLKHLLILFLISIAFNLNSSCKKVNQEQKNEKEITEPEIEQLTKKDIDQIEYVEYVLSDAAENTTKNWVKFQELNNQIEILKQADLSFFKDDKVILKSTIDDLKAEIPEQLNESSIEVRLIALETNMYKLEGISILSNIKKEVQIDAIKEVLSSYTNLIFQINKKLEKDSQSIIKPN